MARTELLFATQVYRTETVAATGGRTLNRELLAACQIIASGDRAGQTWSRRHGYRGYTSYASLADLPWRSPEIAALVERINGHVGAFSRQLGLDLGRRKLSLDSIWINVLEPGGFHSAHIHPHSVISGTYYVDVPAGASQIRFEDPRLAMLMAAPPKRATVARNLRTFVDIVPKVGTLLLWESWLRHEVPVNRARKRRISISFNYGWP